MSTLLMRLAGPLQSWGDSSRFTRRETRAWPTKSGILGLLASAGGRRRTDSIEDLAGLRFGVRVDQPGRLIRDFQTARPRGAAHSGLSQRYYLADAVFIAGVEGERSLLEGLNESLRSPAFPLFLGRRSCPPAEAIALGVVDEGVESALTGCRWYASAWYRRQSGRDLDLEVFVDAAAGTEPIETVRDVPLSFDSVRRDYGWRDVSRFTVPCSNPAGSGTDFFAAVAGG